MTSPATPETGPFLIRVTGREGEPLVGRYLHGPRDAGTVRRLGYSLGEGAAEAWPFPNRRQADAKLRILARHMGMSEMQFEVIPKGEECSTS